MIDSEGTLGEFLPRLRAADWLAVDTEADSLHAYPEKLCLIQLSTALGDELIDPLAPMDLQPLWLELKKHQLILHGADYDLRLLRKNHGFVPARIFDTMLASRLLGEREFGLVNLVKKWLNVALEKGSQKADWSKRPLTPRMEEYARNDTRYLKPLAGILEAQLREKGRLAWLEQSCERLIAECATPTSPEPDLVWRVKGSHKLGRAELAILREIWHWREQEAIAANKPPYFVLSHEALVEITLAMAENRLVDKWLPRYFSPRRKDGLHDAIQKALTLPPEEHPAFHRPIPKRQTEAERRRFNELELKRNKKAEELELDPTLIASRAMLLALAEDWNCHQTELMEWQRVLLA
ncbi:MAG TPA: HRDC domain-containing protein [Candidatus Saccharimonadales bacterium]|nr:HRDC domain-containing protein [Candidatus Saccharimonadales bacterium]